MVVAFHKVGTLEKLSLEQQLSAAINEDSTLGFMKNQMYDYQSIFLTQIVPDNTNPRFFPAICMTDEHADQFIGKNITKRQLSKIYDAEDKVLIGKSCIINCCKFGSSDFKKANETIDSVIELGENIAVSEVIQVPTVYPVEGGQFKILTGHRRYFAMIYAHGINTASHFKVYQSKPVLQKTKQFQENASREDLPQYGKLRAFQDAMLEIDVLNTSKKKMGLKPLTVKEKANTLGISMGAFDNYNVLCRYPAVVESYESGNRLSFVKVKKRVLELERQLFDSTKKLNVTQRRVVNKALKDELIHGIKQVDEKAVDANENQTKKVYELGKIKSVNVVKQLITKDLTTLDTGIDWDALDWDDADAVNTQMKALLEYLENH